MATAERPTIELAFMVNGRAERLTLEPRETLLQVLRDRLGLYGAKESCNQQVCGACTVLLDGLAISACSVLAYEARGREVLTIEGLAAEGRLHPIQQAFVDHAALQCGFCTPGMILAAKALLDDVADPTEEEVRHGLAGNICRCTGYVKIIEAVMDAADRLGREG
jgi:carbon-monoxide dehydrogenase small subunit